jgi:type II secretory pathway component PulF
MAVFLYRAKDRSGSLIEDRIDSGSKELAIDDLTKRGLFIISLDEEEALLSSGAQNLKLKDVAQFSQRLSELISSGLPLLRGLDILTNQFKKSSISGVIREMALAVRGGSNFSEALRSFKFPPLLPALVASGEASGNLERVLNEAGNIFQKELDLKSQVKSAMFYPGLVMSAGFLTIFFLLSFVIPRISEIFTDLGQSLPLLTEIIVSLSNLLAGTWWLVLALIISFLFLFKKYRKREEYLIISERVKSKIPILSKIFNFREVILFTKTLGFLIESGIPLIDAVKLSSSVVGSIRYRKKMNELTESLREGGSLNRGLEGFLPQDVVDIISVGEESGNLDRALLKVSQNYEKELDYNLKVATQLLEPLMILFVGAVVGTIVIAVLLPIFQLNLIIR